MDVSTHPSAPSILQKETVSFRLYSITTDKNGLILPFEQVSTPDTLFVSILSQLTKLQHRTRKMPSTCLECGQRTDQDGWTQVYFDKTPCSQCTRGCSECNSTGMRGHSRCRNCRGRGVEITREDCAYCRNLRWKKKNRRFGPWRLCHSASSTVYR